MLSDQALRIILREKEDFHRKIIRKRRFVFVIAENIFRAYLVDAVYEVYTYNIKRVCSV